MSRAKYEFTELRMNSPMDNLTAAIGIIQTEILAGDTGLDPDVLFGADHFNRTRAGLEAAVALLAPIVAAAYDRNLRWDDGE